MFARGQTGMSSDRRGGMMPQHVQLYAESET